MSDAFPYFDYLLEKHEIAAAVRAWRGTVQINSQVQGYNQPGNLIVNGDVEKDFLNGGFDWRYKVIDPVQLSIDTVEFHIGATEVFMIFKGPAIADVGILEYVPVSFNTPYDFSVYIKAEDIESSGDPRLLAAYGSGLLNIDLWNCKWSQALGLAAFVGCTGMSVHSALDFNLQIPANTCFFYFVCAVTTCTGGLRNAYEVNRSETIAAKIFGILFAELGTDA